MTRDYTAGDCQLCIRVIEGVANVGNSWDRACGTLACGRDRSIQTAVRLAQPRKQREGIGLGAAGRQCGEGGFEGRNRSGHGRHGRRIAGDDEVVA